MYSLPIHFSSATNLFRFRSIYTVPEQNDSVGRMKKSVLDSWDSVNGRLICCIALCYGSDSEQVRCKQVLFCRFVIFVEKDRLHKNFLLPDNSN